MTSKADFSFTILKNYFVSCVLLCIFEHVLAHVHMQMNAHITQYVCGNQRATWRSQFFLPAMWTMGTNIMLSGWVPGTSICWAVLLVLITLSFSFTVIIEVWIHYNCVVFICESTWQETVPGYILRVVFPLIDVAEGDLINSNCIQSCCTRV